MKALLLAAGLGTRLGSLTADTPKCLMDIAGEPIVLRLVRQLHEAGVSEFLINTHYLAEQVEECVRNSPWSEAVELVHEPVLLGTAGSLRTHWRFFGGQAGVVLHADNFFEFSLAPLIAGFDARPAGIDMTMLVFEAEDPSSCGVVDLDERGTVVGFHEKVAAPPTNLASAATMVVAPDIIDDLMRLPEVPIDLSLHLIPALLGRINVVRAGGPVIDIGSAENLARARVLASTCARPAITGDGRGMTH
ncbi:MAG: nucleotidyltransferase family protein [Actinomycetota bacterium]|nr:nucleotidyltransferase family protein [Actinomycetota bacterium]